MDQSKKCRFCKLVKPHSAFGRWPDCKDGLHYFCTECWEGFCRQGNAYDKEALFCSKCNQSKPVSEFYRECVFGSRAPWCNLCRTIFISKHSSPVPLKVKIQKPPKPPKPPSPPKLFACRMCSNKKPSSEFGLADSGKQNRICTLCREKGCERYKKNIKCVHKTKEFINSAILRADISGTKICSACSLEKPLSQFPADSRRILGVGSSCRECRSEKQRLKIDAAKALAAEIRDTEDNFQPQDGIKYFRCRKCQKNKSLIEFAKAPGRKEGHDLWCRECSKERKRKWHENHPAPYWEEKAADRCNKRAHKKGLPSGMKPADLYDPNTGALPVFCPIFPDTRLDYQSGPNRRTWASVDRKIPALGYVSGNVWVVSNSANTWKSNGGNEKDKKIIEKLTRNGRKTKTLDSLAQKSLFD